MTRLALRQNYKPVRRFPADDGRPLHQQLGIETAVYRIPVLAHIEGAGRKPEAFDKVTETWSNNHLFRASVTLAKV